MFAEHHRLHVCGQYRCRPGFFPSCDSSWPWGSTRSERPRCARVSAAPCGSCGKSFSCLLDDLLVLDDDRLQVLGIQDPYQASPSLCACVPSKASSKSSISTRAPLHEHLDEAAIAIVCEARVAGFFARPSTVTSLRPRLRMVFIIPGMENLAPERTLRSSGSAASPASCQRSFRAWQARVVT